MAPPYNDECRMRFTDIDKTLNISIPISTMVIAYARKHMSKFKNLDSFIIYYTETESLFTNKQLDEKLVS